MKSLVIISILLGMVACTNSTLNVEVYETSASGKKLQQVVDFPKSETTTTISLNPAETHQEIIGIGGSFTESSAYLLNQLSKENYDKIIEAYFGESGARYSLTRTHINSCDFSLENYSYAQVEGDTSLTHFSIDDDRDDIIPMIKEAQKVSKEGFKILSSPWTAPPWMKDNKSWKGGKLLPEFYNTWALFFSKYIKAYKKEGIDIWAVTVENEPLGNDSNWESMHYTPTEMVDFVSNHLGPKLADEKINTKILGFDQNRDEQLKVWVDEMYKNDKTSKYFDGTAVHWYASTVDWFPKALNYVHNKAPEKLIIQSEGCIDSQVPVWKNDEWYWQKEATDWGWDWAPEEDKHHHPKYSPVYRYARDMIGCFNSSVNGWIDWNMVLDTKGGPNWANNWCIAPVIVDPKKDEVYFTPLYYTMAHFSKYIRPGAIRIGIELSDDKVMATAVQNTDNSIVVVLLNMNEEAQNINLSLNDKSAHIAISGRAIQTIIL